MTHASLRIDHVHLCSVNEQWLKMIWAAAYGAYVAAQVQDCMNRGLGPPDQDRYLAISEDAAQVADDATHSYLTNVQTRNIK